MASQSHKIIRSIMQVNEMYFLHLLMHKYPTKIRGILFMGKIKIKKAGKKLPAEKEVKSFKDVSPYPNLICLC